MSRHRILGMLLQAGVVSTLLLMGSGSSNAQSADKAPGFEAATIRPAAPPPPGVPMSAGRAGGPGTQDPGRIRYPFITLKALLLTAYDVKSFQIQGPPWLETERFELNATMPEGTTAGQFHAMLQKLLLERFKLTIHRETKEFPVYSLVAARGEVKMKESKAPAPDKDGADANATPGFSVPKMGKDGFPALPDQSGGAGLFLMMLPGRARLIGRQQTMADLSNRLTALLNRPVNDATGLTAKYDFTLTFASEGISAPMGAPQGAGMAVSVGPPMPAGPPPDAASPGAAPEEDNLPTIFRAVKDQLGLTLESKKGPVQVIVIDHAERAPVEN